MGTIWAVISLLAVWLIYGLFAALFVKGIGSRDAIPLLLSGMIGGATGGQLSQLMEIPTYLWWMSELMKFLLTILSLYIISIYWKQRKSKKNNNCPAWSINAKKITHDKIKQNILIIYMLIVLILFMNFLTDFKFLE